MKLFIIAFSLIAVIVQEILAHSKCISDEISKKIVKEKIDLYGGQKRFLQTTTWSPIRIYVDYTTLNAQASTVSASIINDIQTVVNATVAAYQKLLSVKASSNLLSVTSCPAGSMTLTISTAVKNGVNYDLILFPFVDTTAVAGVEAYAAPCALDLSTNRPLAGVIGFGSISYNMTNAAAYYEMLVLHEINHVLAFNSDLFPTFIDSTGNLLSNPITYKVVNGLNRTLLSTPNVIATAKNYFNCSSVTGVELENQGGTGTAGSHWEARIMLGDYMLGESFAENVISDITLAVFADSGWYQVNYYSGGLFRFGKDAGCSFLNSPCVINQTVADINDYTTGLGTQMCLGSHTGKGYSSLQKGLSINNQSYEYFSDTTEGGFDLADYCPVAFNNIDDGTNYFPGHCIYGASSTYPTSLGEVIGSNSNCFMSSLTPNNDNSVSDYVGTNFAICYPITCNSANGTYNLLIGSATVTCPRGGGSVAVSGFSGSIICPDYNLLCTRNGVCTDAMDCLNKGITALTSTYDYTNQYDIALSGSSAINSTFLMIIGTSGSSSKLQILLK